MVASACAPAPDAAPGDPAGPTDSTPTDTGVDRSEGPGGNILLVFLDDVGIDKFATYDLHPTPPPTPVIDGLAAEGIRFENAYATPTCSPSRAALLTGRYGRRTGVGRTVNADATPAQQLSGDEVGLPEALERAADGAYRSAIVGKWHLGAYANPSGTTHPAEFGFDTYRLGWGNLQSMTLEDGNGSYERWEKNVDGALSIREAYATTDTFDDALELAVDMPEPWFLQVSTHAAHDPFHWPPHELHTQDERAALPSAKYAAMLEAADTELGRMLDGLPPALRERTTIIVMGDNGTPWQATQAPFPYDRAKATLFEGGTHVPLIIAGEAVSRVGEVDASLVHLVDVHETIRALAGVADDASEPPRDGISFAARLTDANATYGRTHVYTEAFAPNGYGEDRTDGRWALRDERWKVTGTEADGVDGLYDLTRLAGRDGRNLLADGITEEEQAHADRLEAAWQAQIQAIDTSEADFRSR